MRSHEKELVVKAYDAVARSGDYEARFDTPLARAEDLEVARVLRRHGFLGRRLLDVGCGAGHLIGSFAPDRCFAVATAPGGPPHVAPVAPELRRELYLGVDISGEMVRRAVQLHPGYSFVHADFEEWDPALFNGDRFEAVTCVWAEAYFDDRARAYRRMHDLLRVGGRLFVITYSERHATKPNYSLADYENGRPPHRVCRLEDTAQVVLDAGFRLLDARPFATRATAPRWLPAWALRLLLRADNARARRHPERAFYHYVVGERTH